MTEERSEKPISLPSAAQMPAGSRSLVRWLWFFLQPYRVLFVCMWGLRLARRTVMSLVPLGIGLMINAINSGEALQNPGHFWNMLGLFSAIYGAALWSIIVFQVDAKALDQALRGLTLFSVRHLNALPLSWHESQGSGGKLQRIMTARASFKRLIQILNWSMVPFIGTFAGAVISIVMLKAPLAIVLMYFGFAATFFTAAWLLARPLSKLHNQHNIWNEQLLSRVYEFVSAVQTAKFFNLEPFIMARAQLGESRGHGAMRKVFESSFRKWALLNMVGLFWLLSFVAVGFWGVQHGWLSVGAFATVFFLAYNFWAMLEEVIFMQDEFYEHRNGFLRLAETLDAVPESYDREPLAVLPEDWKTITFDHVDFSYRAGAPSLNEVSLTIRRGEKIALVGRSGAGKTTMVKLLLKQLRPDSGAIRVDDIDLAHIPSASWLAHAGVVPQDVELFNMSLRENILLDRDETDADFYESCLKKAALHDLVQGLPEKDATMVGERGIKLSGGQKQRVGIARCLVRKADLVIFDEATSSLDSLSERLIHKAIEDSFSGDTLILIAHRLSTIRHADRIIVLDEGRIVEQGNFNELLERAGAFAALWKMQSEGFSEERPLAGSSHASRVA